MKWRVISVLFLFSLCAVMLFSCSKVGTIGSDSLELDQTELPGTSTEASEEGRIEITYHICDTGGGSIEGWRTQHGAPGETTAREVTAVAKTGYVFTGWSDGNKESTRRDVFGDSDASYTANFSYDTTVMPILSITTDTGGDVTSKTDYIGCSITLCNTGSTAYEICEEPAEIRGRGNATWTFEKKSYRLHFEQKVQLLGLGNGKEKNWILMANQCDQSMLRNYLSIFMANELSGIDYNSSGTFVEVYLNGSYRGVYLLAEQIEDSDSRIYLGNDTLEDSETTEIGFLVEMDAYAEGDHSFAVGSKMYEVKSDVATDEQFEYICDYITNVDALLSEGDQEKLEEVFDLDSAVDGYLLEEFFKNIDVGWSSIYMYKSADPDDVLHWGPFWDFDLAAGNDYRLDDGSFEDLYVGADYGFSQSNRWFIRLMRQEWFRQLAAERWFEISDVLDDVIAELDRVSEWGAEAFNRNFEVWPIFGQRINQEPEQVMALDSYEEHVAYLRNWLVERREWLDNAFAEYLP